MKDKSSNLLLLIMVIAFTGTMAFRVSVPAVTFFTRKILEASALNIGFLTSSFFAARAMFSIVAGSLSDRYGSKVVYAAFTCFLINGIVVQLYSIAGNVISIVAIRFIQGALNGISWVSVQYVLGKSVKKELRGRVYAVYFAFGSLGIVVGNIAYSLFSQSPIKHVLNISTALFIITSALTLFIARNLHVMQDRTEIKRDYEKRSVSKLKLIHILPLILVVFNVMFFASMLRGDLVYVYINEFFNVNEALVAQTIALSSLTALVGGYLIGWFSDKFNDITALKIALSIAFIGGFTISINVFPLAILGLAMFYTANSGIIPVSRKVAVTYYRLGGTALGLVNAIGNVGAVIGASVLGYLYDIFDNRILTIFSLKFSAFAVVSILPLALSLALSLLLQESYKRINY